MSYLSSQPRSSQKNLTKCPTNICLTISRERKITETKMEPLLLARETSSLSPAKKVRSARALLSQANGNIFLTLTNKTRRTVARKSKSTVKLLPRLTIQRTSHRELPVPTTSTHIRTLSVLTGLRSSSPSLREKLMLLSMSVLGDHPCHLARVKST